MRIISFGLFAASVLVITDSSDAPQIENTGNVETNIEHLLIDPITTGVTVSSEQREQWEAEFKRYIECPECVPTQPYPEEWD